MERSSMDNHQTAIWFWFWNISPKKSIKIICILIITLCQLLKVVVTESLENTGRSLGDGDGLALPRGDPRRRDRGGAAVFRRTTEDLTEKDPWGVSFGTHPPAFTWAARQRTFLCSSIRISTTIFWNLMSNMAATVSTWALNSVGPKITAMLEGVIRLSSLWLHTLWTDTELSSWQIPLEITTHNRSPYVTKCLMSISSISRFFSGNL